MRIPREFRWPNPLWVCLTLIVFFSTSPSKAEPSFQQAFERHNAVMLLIDPTSGQIVDANAAAARFYGYARARLTQMKIQDINQLSPEQVLAERKLAETEGRNYFIFRHKLADGDIKTVEVHSIPLDFDGRNLLFSIIIDISKTRSLEEDLWHYQSQLETMVDRQTAQLQIHHTNERRWSIIAIVALSVMVGLLLYTLIRHKRVEGFAHHRTKPTQYS